MNKREPTDAKSDLPYQPAARIERRLASVAAKFWAGTGSVNQRQSQRRFARIRSPKRQFVALAFLLLLPVVIRAGENGMTDFPVLRRPLSKVEALNIAIARNGTILEAKKDAGSMPQRYGEQRKRVFPNFLRRHEK
jgi:hypothetical protein